MMFMKYIVLLFCLCLLESCSSNKRQNNVNTTNGSFVLNSDTKPRIIKVKLDDKDFYNRVDDCLRMVSYVKLAPVPLLAPIVKILVSDGRIYIQDRLSQLVCYDMDGHVVFHIKAVGSGPGEYAEISSFALDELRGELVLYDDLKTSLLYYSMDKGRFLRKVNFQKPNPSEIVFHDSVFFYNNRNHKSYPNDSLLHYSLLSSKDGLIIDKYCFPHDSAEEEYIFSPSLQTFNINDDKLYYCKNFDTTIYEVSSDSVRSCYKLDLPNLLPNSVIKDRTDERTIVKSNYSFGISHVYESGRLLYFRFYNGGYIWNCFYDLYCDKQICCVKALQEKPTPNVPLIDIVDGVYEGMFYSLLTPEFIDYYVSQSPQDYPTDFQLYDAESDNPIVMFYNIIE